MTVNRWERERVSHSVLSNSLWCHGLEHASHLCPLNSPGKKTGVGSHSFLQGIFSTQGSNPGLLDCIRFFPIWATREDPWKTICCYGCWSVTESYLTLQPHELQRARLLCPSLSSWVCLNSSPMSLYTIQPSHPLSPPSPPALKLSQQQGIFQWVSSSHQVAKVLELQLQHQSFQWIFRVNFH